MKAYRKIISLLLLISVLISAVGCGEYHGAIGGGKLPDGAAPQPDLDNDPTNDFTVRLRLNGEVYVPMTAINVYWSDGYSIHVAPIDSQGTATIDGLDGDYKVTLSSTPSGYAYDPNAYVATNDSRHVIIDMYDLNLVSGAGTGLYSCYRVESTGIYSVTIREDLADSDADGSLIQKVYFEFAPQESGTYTIESWADTSLDEVHPICTAYLGSSAFKYGGYTVTDVGACGSFTRNFVHTIEIADEMISSGGSQTFTFAVSAETKSGVYPVTYSFAIKRNGGFDMDKLDKSTIVPTHNWSGFDFNAFNALAGGEIQNAAVLYDEGAGEYYVFDEDNYRIGSDGVYHVYDPVKYASTGGYGPILVAYITEPCYFLGTSFAEIDTAGYGTLTKIEGQYNYKVFIEGFKAAADAGYYCVNNCPCHVEGDVYACLEGCTECTSQCTNCTNEIMSAVGYVNYCNDDGVAPVTPELALFLQRIARGQRYFADGHGTIDSQKMDGKKFDAYEDSQWLFACGYYE